MPVGKPALPFIREGCREYLQRLRPYTEVELSPLRKVDPSVVQSIRRQCEPRPVHLLLDERGELLTTREFAALIEGWQFEARSTIACWVGGAGGHPAELRSGADRILALGRFTLQHELALLVFLEQLYRVHTLLRGEPYHRD